MSDDVASTPKKKRGCLWGCLTFFLGIFLVLLCLAAIWYWINFAGAPQIVAGSPAVSVAPETTFLESPLDENGDVDYLAAINEKLSVGVTPENNSMIPIVEAIGPTPEDQPLSDSFFEQFGIPVIPAEGEYFLEFRDWFDAREAAEEARISEEFLKRIEANPDAELEEPDCESRPNWVTISPQYDFALANPWSAKEFPLLSEWLQEMETPLGLAVQASSRSRYYHPLVTGGSATGPPVLSAPLSYVQGIRHLSYALSIRAMHQLKQGNVDAAIADTMAIYRLGQLMAQGNTMVEQLVAYAIRKIGHECSGVIAMTGQADQQQLQQLIDELESSPDLHRNLTRALTYGERLMALDATVQLARGNTKSIGSAEGSWMNDMGRAVDWNQALRVINQKHDQLAEMAQIEDYSSRSKANVKFENEMRDNQRNLTGVSITMSVLGGRQAKGQKMGEILADLLMPAWYQIDSSMMKTKDLTRMSVVALKLAQYKLQHKNYPAELSALVPDYFPETPVDESHGLPFIYHLQTKESDSESSKFAEFNLKPGEYLLYSCGPNGTDDGATDEYSDYLFPNVVYSSWSAYQQEQQEPENEGEAWDLP